MGGYQPACQDRLGACAKVLPFANSSGAPEINALYYPPDSRTAALMVDRRCRHEFMNPSLGTEKTKKVPASHPMA
jgi:hypothetical protein